MHGICVTVILLLFHDDALYKLLGKVIDILVTFLQKYIIIQHTYNGYIIHIYIYIYISLV